MIKMIAFDFGGVYFTYNGDILTKSLAKELDTDIKTVKKAWHDNGELKSFEKGKISEKNYWKAFLKIVNKAHDTTKLNKIVINHFKPIPQMIKLVDKLSSTYQIGMISNQTTWLDKINKKYNFFHKFNPLIISKNVGYQKPDKRIFEIFLKETNLQPNEIIFIDDGKNYQKTIEKLGMKFIHFKNPKQTKVELKKLGIKF